jgi:hypothetical protein
MKILYFGVFLLLFQWRLYAQNGDSLTTSILPGNVVLQTDTTIIQTNKYGDLLNDDPAYNPKYKWWIPATRVVAADAFNWAVAKYVYKFDWPATSVSDWKYNFKKGPEWDEDGFGTNFIGHPHTGNYYFNIARSNGYSYWGSLPFAIEGSLIWE